LYGDGFICYLIVKVTGGMPATARYTKFAKFSDVFNCQKLAMNVAKNFYLDRINELKNKINKQS